MGAVVCMYMIAFVIGVVGLLSPSEDVEERERETGLFVFLIVFSVFALGNLFIWLG